MITQAESDDLAHLNKTSAVLAKKIKDQAFTGMRAVFLNHVVLTRVLMKHHVTSLQESEAVITQLTTKNPSQEVLSLVDDPKLAALLVEVSNCQIGDLRNRVVHKSGYRPSLAEVESAISETQTILYGLQSVLGTLTDHVDWYRKCSQRYP